MEDKEFIISTIIPVYNVEKYLRETIDSVIDQTIGFENIQMILVNDGSPDNSEKICLEYKEKYPDNIVYIKQENKGVSAARNNGFKHAKGKYINFFDSDDVWSKDAYEKGIEFLENNKEVDVVAFRLKYFEASKDYHTLDYKFIYDGIVDIMKKPSFIVLHANSCIIRSEAIPENPFDTRLKICEDTTMLFQILFDKQKYGMISSVCYNYRKRVNQSSAMQSAKTKPYWYTDTIKYAHKFLIELSNKNFGKVIPFLQYFLMYESQWRIKSGIAASLNSEEKEQYNKDLRYIISLIDDEVIAFQKNLTLIEKFEAFILKYGNSVKKKFKVKDNKFYINKTYINNVFYLSNNIEIFEINKNNKLLIIGNINYFEKANFYIEYNSKQKKLNTIEREHPAYETLKLDVYKNEYKVELDIKENSTIKFYIEINGKKYLIRNSFIHYSRLRSLPNAYYYENKYLFTKNYDKDNYIESINVRKSSCFKAFIKEIKYLSWLLFKNKKACCIRILYWLTKPFYKNIFLFADREFMAGDSAEVLFKYFNKVNKNKKSKTYFAVEKESEDFEKMKEFGRVVDYHSLKYKMLFLHAKFLISSHADEYVNNEFGKTMGYYADLYRFRYIYLTHGILLHDSSQWLNRINKNFTLNVATSPMEYESLLEDKYFFDKNQIIKTGMPRYDNLMNMKVKEENKILFMPSWRSTLTGPVIPNSQHRQYNPKFKESEYFLFYKKLFSDKRLLDALKKSGLKIKFCIHPSFRAQVKDFKGNEYVEFAIDVNSQYETLSSKFLVTDYSSAACDFAYMNKPVIYANFDIDHIYDVHYYNKGYFDYDIHGFGPNCKDYETFLNEMLKLINNDCKLEKKWENRMKKFFFYRDNKNSERVYKEIMKLNDKL